MVHKVKFVYNLIPLEAYNITLTFHHSDHSFVLSTYFYFHFDSQELCSIYISTHLVPILQL